MTERDLDALTAREREVLALIGHGRTNEEIAERFGITLDGAKYHVSQILSKLGVGTREEAADAAAAAKPPAQAPERRRWWAAWPLAAQAAGATVVVAAVAGLGVLAWGVLETSGTEDSPATVAGQPVVPWVDSTPGPTSSPTPIPSPNPNTLAVRACGSEDLVLRSSGSNSGRDADQIGAGFANDSGSPCRLQGTPPLDLLDAGGNVISVVADPITCFPASPATCPAKLPVIVAPGDNHIHASITIALESDECGRDAAVALIARVRLEDGSLLDIPLSHLNSPGVLVCNVGLTHFYSSQAPQSPFASVIPTSLDLPTTTQRGNRLEFTVTLTNTGQETISFEEPCPNYAISLSNSTDLLRADEWDRWASHSLNCLAAASLAPGESVKFQMMVRVPDDAPVGDRALFWSLDRMVPGASAEIEVVD